MKKQSSGKPTLQQSLQLHLRSLKTIHQHCPGVLLSTTLYQIVDSLKPYAAIYFSAQIINELAGQRRTDTLFFWIMLTVITEAALYLIWALLQRWKEHKSSWSFYKRIDSILTDKMYSMDFSDVDKQETLDQLTQIQQSSNWSGWGSSKTYYIHQNLISSLLGICGSVALTVSLFTLPVPESAEKLTILNHPLFIMLIIALMAAVTFIGSWCSTKSNALWAAGAEGARLGNRIFSYFGFLNADSTRALDCRIYNQQEIISEYLKSDNAFSPNGYFSKLSRGKMGILLGLSEGIAAGFTGLAYIFVCLKAWGGAFGVGSVTQYISSITAMSRSFSGLIGAIGDIRNNAPFLQDLFRFLEIPNAMYQGSLTTEKRADRQYEVEFRDVSFKYPGSSNWALRHLNLKFKVGSRMAVVGENGSGKTTFIKLLCRLYDPQEGQILLNGIDIRKYDYRNYMDIFSVVFQDFQLLSQPLGANVASSMEYDRERARKCLIDAGFGDRLATLPDGLDTMLYKTFGEEGIDVSGGEAQKIAIARALYKNAPFIILDEPTAALDPLAEAEVYSKFNEIAGDKTAIYISHRLSSCKFCDEIAVFHKGMLVQQGTHCALLNQPDGKYYELWNAQAQYYT